MCAFAGRPPVRWGGGAPECRCFLAASALLFVRVRSEWLSGCLAAKGSSGAFHPLRGLYFGVNISISGDLALIRPLKRLTRACGAVGWCRVSVGLGVRSGSVGCGRAGSSGRGPAAARRVARGAAAATAVRRRRLGVLPPPGAAAWWRAAVAHGGVAARRRRGGAAGHRRRRCVASSTRDGQRRRA